ncbi:MAG: type II secretion system F family protein [Collinsella sp.]|nr:type II secretion system F family protein [Collinsella sp.]
MEEVMSCSIGVLVGASAYLAPLWSPVSRTGSHDPSRWRGLLRRGEEDLGRGVEILLEPFGSGVAARVAECSMRAFPRGHRAPRRCLGLLAMSIGVAGILGGFATWSVPGIPMGMGLAGAGVLARSRRVRREERSALERSMPEAFGALAISLGSGNSLAQAMRYVGAHMEGEVGAAFLRVGFSIECGVPSAEALDDMLGSLSAPGLDLVALALKVSKRTGAPPGGLLADAARFVGDRMDLERLLDVKTAQARLSASVVAIMPLAMVSFLLACSTDYRKGAATATGMACLLIALLLDAVAWRVIQRAMKVGL